MRKLGLSLGSLTVVVLLALLAGSASAYVLLSPTRTWDCAPDYIVDNRAGGVPSILDADGGRTRVINAITSNADAWNSESSGTVIKAHAGSVAGFSLGDNVPMLNFTDPLSACTGTCLAATFTAYYNERAAGSGSWRINDADIVTNSTGYNWTSQGEDPGGAGCSSEIYIEGVMVHEIGHGLGLGHSAVAGATMLSSVSYCNNNPATTEADDAAGLNALYGSGFGWWYDTYTNYLTGTGMIQLPAVRHLLLEQRRLELRAPARHRRRQRLRPLPLALERHLLGACGERHEHQLERGHQLQQPERRLAPLGGLLLQRQRHLPLLPRPAVTDR